MCSRSVVLGFQVVGNGKWAGTLLALASAVGRQHQPGAAMPGVEWAPLLLCFLPACPGLCTAVSMFSVPTIMTYRVLGNLGGKELDLAHCSGG